MALNNLSLVKVSNRAFTYDDHEHVHSVSDRETGRLIGHVGHTRNARYGRKHGTWVYLHVSDNRDSWTVAGWTRAEAVDRLMSADSPTGAYVSGVA